jgi:hypothetical protein
LRDSTLEDLELLRNEFSDKESHEDLENTQDKINDNKFIIIMEGSPFLSKLRFSTDLNWVLLTEFLILYIQAFHIHIDLLEPLGEF